MIDPAVLEQLRSFAERLDHASPGTLEGFYAVGSVALGDFHPTLSNLDVVAVTSDGWDAAALAQVRAASRRLHRPRQPSRIACVTWDELAADPGQVDAPCFVGRRPLPSSELVNPLTWAVMRTAAVSVTGPEYPSIGAGDLRQWAADRLTGWWATWLQGSDARTRGLLLRRWESERVLEVARLAQVVRSGRVVSKLEAGELAAVAATPRFQRILKDSAGYRQGARMSMYWGPFERRNHAIAYIGEQTTAGAVLP